MNYSVIIPYYGKFPSFFELFLKSCKNNKNCDFIIVTDNLVSGQFPENVYFINISFSSLITLIEKKINHKVNIKHPYKLCDFKPMYGLIFEDYLREYDYWGFGDIDLIYGNFSKFKLEQKLFNHDVISFREKWISGCLCFLRNVKQINELFYQGTNLSEIFNYPDYKGFDETSLVWSNIMDSPLGETDFPYSNFTKIISENLRKGKIRAYFNTDIKESIKKNEYLEWSNGNLKNNVGAEYMLYHYISEKKSFFFTFWIKNEIPNKLYIDNSGFYTENQFFTQRRKIRLIRKTKSIPVLISSYRKRIMRKFRNLF